MLLEKRLPSGGRECRLLHAADKANQTPFLVFMHARYDQYYIENLSALREWSSGEETIYTREAADC